MLYGVQFSFIDHIMESFLLGMTLWEFFCMWRLNSVDMWTFIMGEICLEESLRGHYMEISYFCIASLTEISSCLGLCLLSVLLGGYFCWSISLEDF